jgi:translocation and assembly module TamB
MERSAPPDPDLPPPRFAAFRLWPRRWRYRGLIVCVLLLLVSGSATWLGRERIAGNLIDGYLAENGVEARYDIVAIGPTQQVIANLVVGNPAAPDLTADRLVIDLGLGLVGPAIERVTVERARLFGTLTDGRLSLGALDPLVFTGSEEPAALPRIDVALRDARTRIESDFGTIALRLAGSGRLDDGFAGTLAVTAPGIGSADCRAERATMFGALTTRRGQPEFAGPIRLGGLACAGVMLAGADIGSNITLADTLDDARVQFAVSARGLSARGTAAARITGTATAALSARGTVLEHDLTLRDAALPYARIAALTARGTWRSGGAGSKGTGRSEWSGEITGRGMALTEGARREMSTARQALAGTLLEPLAGQLAGGIASALEGSRFASEAIIRHSEDTVRLIVPEARLRSGAGETLLALSQVSWALTGGKEDGAFGGARGNFITGGRDLPRFNGRFADEADGGFSLRLAMADYAAGDSRLALPRFTLERDADGPFRFAGLVTASGVLPGGSISGLQLPIEGLWSAGSGLEVGTRCTSIRFQALRFAELDLNGRQVDLCPNDTRAMLRYDKDLQMGLRTSRLALVGRMDGNPVGIAADRAVVRYPGPLSVEEIDFRIGEAGASQTRLSLTTLTGRLGGSLQGEFAGGKATLGALTLAFGEMAGRWSFSESGLAINDAQFVLSDRGPDQARFEPLEARAASLRMAGDDITAAASLYYAPSGQKIAAVRIGHDLATAAGQAEFRIDDLTFGPALDISDLSYLAKGVVAFAEGSVSGSGRVAWAGDTVTSEGTFCSDGLAFAAAFGPVRGVKGEIRFTDLLSLTTAPGQRLAIAAIDTGVEVLDGRVTFALTNGQTIAIADARWPFMDGELVLRPMLLDFSAPSEKRYVFEITGLDAATFVAEMELTNLAVTGRFDGVVPIVFDRSGNGRVENGLLRARPPGGNIAYIGDLTYQDMGAVTNYAFRALRSLDYRDMSVVLDGSLTGEIISKFQFDGVRQGEGSSSNFITRRLARLPILFRVNVKAESFYELSTVVRSFFDASYLGNPVDRGLLRLENRRFVPSQRPASPVQGDLDAPSPALRPDELSVQPPESEDPS